MNEGGDPALEENHMSFWWSAIIIGRQNLTHTYYHPKYSAILTIVELVATLSSPSPVKLPSTLAPSHSS